MGNFQGSVLGTLLTLLGWDGSAFQNILVDSDGHLQVDALTAQLITGFATETTLDAVMDRIGALTAPASGSTNKLLTDMLTALQLIDDLRGALDSVNTDELVVNVDESVLPTDAATETSLQGIEDQIPDQLLGYVDVWRDTKAIANASTGTNTIQSDAVPSGKLLILSSSLAVNQDSVCNSIVITVQGGDSTIAIARDASPAADQGVSFSGYIVLEYPEYLLATFTACTLNDNLYFQSGGHLVTAPT